MQYIDINADVGEGIGNDAILLPYLSSCSIACGGHTGDEKTMRETALLAKQNEVKVGAHPSFPDRVNFGRESISISDSELYASLKEQVNNLIQILQELDMPLHYIKPHGALYNMAAKKESTAMLILEVIKHTNLPIKLFAPWNSVISRLAKAQNIEVVYEAFIDRNYNDDLSLVSRTENNAVILNPKDAFTHLQAMVSKGMVKTQSGVLKEIKAQTYCIHGDNLHAENILRYVHTNLTKMNIRVL